MRPIRTVSILLFAGTLITISCSKNTLETGFFDEDVLSISAFLEKNKQEYSRFWEVLQFSDLYHTLNAYNPNGEGFTLFLPTDDAFDRYIQQNDIQQGQQW